MSGSARPAPSACDRCGALAPLWARAERRLCGDCFDRLRSPIEMEPPTARSLLRGTGKLLARVWLPATLAASVVAVPAVVLTAVLEAPAMLLLVARELASLLSVALVLGLGSRAVSEDAGASGAVATGAPSVAALSRWPALAWVHVLALPSILLGSLLLLLPGLYLLLSFPLAYPMAMRGEASGAQALKRSFVRMEGHRLSLLLAGAALLVPAALLVMAAGVGAAGALGLLLGRAASGEMGIVRAAGMLLVELIKVPFLLLVVVLDSKLRYQAALAAGGRAGPAPPVAG